jgi:hypothetical protein
VGVAVEVAAVAAEAEVAAEAAGVDTEAVEASPWASSARIAVCARTCATRRPGAWATASKPTRACARDLLRSISKPISASVPIRLDRAGMRDPTAAGIDPTGAVLLPIVYQDIAQLGVQHLSIDR